MCRLHCAAALSFIVAGIVDVTGAQAASLRVGDAVQIVHDVKGRQSGDKAWGSKAEGDDVYENEFIRTEVESQARIVLIDRTASLESGRSPRSGSIVWSTAPINPLKASS